jgi:serine/threonine protein kinase
MNETLTLIDETVSEVDLQWQQRLDELIRGDCSEDAFMGHVSSLREAGPYTAWHVIALLDQRYRRGQLPAEMFRSIEAKIAQYELADIDDGTTIDLIPAVATAQPIVAQPIAAQPIAARPIAAPEPRTPESSVPDIGVMLRHRYVLERRLGTGGMGTVFKALDHYRCDLPEGNRHVAVKFLHQKINGRPEILSDLRREFYCAQALSHPNIVKVFELDQDGEFVFFTMEFLDGELLSSLIERLHPGKISRSSAWAIIQGLGAGLAHAHSRNVVHADLKPQNIMVASSGEVRILDFGAASSPRRHRPGTDSDPKGSSTALTPAYASCELLNSKAADPRDDLYALACVSYELLAGEHPFQRRRSTEACDLGLVAPRPDGLTLRQWNALAMGLSWRREDRSISVGDWLAALNPSTSESSPPADTLQVPKPAQIAKSTPAPKPTSAPKSAPPPKPVEVSKPATVPKAAQVPKPTSAPKPARIPRTASTPRATSTLMRVVAALAVAVLGLGLWLSLKHQSMETNPAAPVIAPDTQANSPISPDVFAPHPSSPQLMSSESPSSDGEQAPTDDSPSNDAQVAKVQTPPPQTAKPDAADSAPHRMRVDSISLSAAAYRVRSRQNFAELHVHRTSGVAGGTSFVWWTEPDSAVAGVDFVPQSRITQVLPAGVHAASLFIRLLPNASRKRSAVFHVFIGEPGNGVSLGRVARTTVILPAS